MRATPTPKGATRRRPPLTPQQQALAAAYLPFALTIAQPFAEIFPQHTDEFASAAGLAVAEAARSFDPRRNVKFSTFAAARIRGAIRDAQRLMAPAGYRRRADDAPHTLRMHDDGPACRRREAPADPGPDRNAADVDDRDELETCFRRLPEPHRGAMAAIYLDRLAPEAARRKAGFRYARKRFAQVHREALSMLTGQEAAC